MEKNNNLTTRQLQDIVDNAKENKEGRITFATFLNVVGKKCKARNISYNKMRQSCANLSKKQIKYFKEIFDLCDENGDGVLNHDEINELVTKLNGKISNRDINNAIATIVGSSPDIDFFDFLQIVATHVKNKNFELARYNYARNNLSNKQIKQFQQTFNYYTSSDHKRSIHLSEFIMALRKYNLAYTNDSIIKSLNQLDISYDHVVDSGFITISKDDDANELILDDYDLDLTIDESISRTKDQKIQYKSDINKLTTSTNTTVTTSINDDNNDVKLQIKEFYDFNDFLILCGQSARKENIYKKQLIKASKGLSYKQIEDFQQNFVKLCKNIHSNKLSSDNSDNDHDDDDDDISNLSTDELQEYKRISKISISYTSYISSIDLIKSLKKQYKDNNLGKLDIKTLRSILDEYDQDGNEEIDFSEYLLVMGKHIRYKIKQAGESFNQQQIDHLHQIFNTFDHENNGYINTIDLANIIYKADVYLNVGNKKITKKDTQELYNLIETFNFDPDGEIEFAEFLKVINKAYKTENDAKKLLIEQENKQLNDASQGLHQIQIKTYRAAFDLYDFFQEGKVSSKDIYQVLRELKIPIATSERMAEEMIAMTPSGSKKYYEQTNKELNVEKFLIHWISFPIFLTVLGAEYRNKVKNASDGLTTEQLNDLKQQFLKFDTYDHGHILLQQFITIYEHYYHKITEKELKPKLINCKSLPKITYPEYINIIGKQIKIDNILTNRIKQAELSLNKDQLFQLRKYFKSLTSSQDYKNKDNIITTNQFMMILKQLHLTSSEIYLKHIINQIDIEHSGQCDYALYLDLIAIPYKIYNNRIDNYNKAKEYLTKDDLKIFITSFNQYSELNTKDNQLIFNDDSYNLSIIPLYQKILNIDHLILCLKQCNQAVTFNDILKQVEQLDTTNKGYLYFEQYLLLAARNLRFKKREELLGACAWLSNKQQDQYKKLFHAYAKHGFIKMKHVIDIIRTKTKEKISIIQLKRILKADSSKKNYKKMDITQYLNVIGQFLKNLQLKKDSLKQASANLTKVQIQKIQKTFNFYDKNGDGSISVNELSQVLYKLGRLPTTTNEQDAQDTILKIIKEADTDNSGYIDFTEFLTYMGKSYKEENIAKLQKASLGLTTEQISVFKKTFERYDLDHSGTILLDELEEALIAIGQRPTKADLELIFKKYDENNDGMIDFPEFLSAISYQTKLENLANEKLLTASKGLTDLQISFFKHIFNNYDKSANGLIEANKLFDICTNLANGELIHAFQTATLDHQKTKNIQYIFKIQLKYFHFHLVVLLKP